VGQLASLRQNGHSGWQAGADKQAEDRQAGRTFTEGIGRPVSTSLCFISLNKHLSGRAGAEEEGKGEDGMQVGRHLLCTNAFSPQDDGRADLAAGQQRSTALLALL